MEQLRRSRGEALREARHRAGLSAKQVIDRLTERGTGNPISAQAIYSYEKGNVLLSREVAERLAPVLAVPLTRLLVGDPDFAPADASSDAATSVSAVTTFTQAVQHSQVLVVSEMLSRQARNIRNAACAWLHAHPSIANAEESDRRHHRRQYSLVQWHIRLIVEEAHAQHVDRFSGEYEACKELVDEIENTSRMMSDAYQTMPTQPQVVDATASSAARQCEDRLNRQIEACDKLIRMLQEAIGEGIISQSRD